MLRLFQMPPPPVIPPVAPLATVDSLPSALPDLTAAGGPPGPPPSQYFSPAVILPSLAPSAAGPLPASPALPLQTVKLSHTAGPPLAMPCQTIVPNVAATATAIPLLAVAPQGVATLSIHPAVAQLPAQPVYQAAFPQMVPADIPPSPLHTAQAVQAAPLQPAPPVLPQPHLPSVTHLPEPAAVPQVGSQVMPTRRACCPTLGDPVVPMMQRARGSAPLWLEGGAPLGTGQQAALSAGLALILGICCLLPLPAPVRSHRLHGMGSSCLWGPSLAVPRHLPSPSGAWQPPLRVLGRLTLSTLTPVRTR